MLTFVANLPWKADQMRAIISQGADIRSLWVPQTDSGYTFGVAYADLVYPFDPSRIRVRGAALNQQPLVRLLPAVIGEPAPKARRKRRAVPTYTAPTWWREMDWHSRWSPQSHPDSPMRIVQDEHRDRPLLRDDPYDGNGFDPTLCRTCQRKAVVAHGWCEDHQEQICVVTEDRSGRPLHWIIPTEHDLDCYLARLWRVSSTRTLNRRARRTFEAMSMAVRYYAAEADRLSPEDAEALGVARWSELARRPRRRRRQ